MELETRTSGLQRVLSNVAFHMGSNVLGRVLNILLHAALGRFFGPPGLGGYSTAVAFSAYFVFLVDFGLAPRLTREGAVAPGRLEHEYATALGLKFLTGAAALVGLCLLVRVLPYADWVRELCLLLGLSSIVRSFSYLNEAVCRAKERLDLEAISTLTGVVTLVASALYLIVDDHPIRWVGFASIASSLVQLVVSTIIAGRFVHITAKMPIDWKIARAALPYATTSFTMLAFAQIDILVLSFIETSAFVGRYASVSRLLLAAGTIGVLTSMAILPTFARLFSRAAPGRFREVVNEAIGVFLLVGGLASIGLFVVADQLILLVYGAAFSDLSSQMRIGSVYLVFTFSASILAVVLTASGRQAERARAVIIGLVGTVVLITILVPMFGIGGAVWTLIASEVLLAICLAAFLRETLDRARCLRTLVVVISAVSLGVIAHSRIAASSFREWMPMMAVAIPVLVYVAIAFASGEGMRALRFAADLRKSG